MRIIAIICAYFSMVSAEHFGIEHSPAPEEDSGPKPKTSNSTIRITENDSTIYIVPGDSNYDYDTSNQEASPLNEDST